MAAKRSTLLEPVNTLEAVRKAWNYPVFDAIFQRRARRFPLGATMPGDLAPFTSTKEPVPLDEIEEAMLVMAGTGISGMNLADLPYDEKGGANFCGNTMLQFVGRVYASACGSHGTELFYTNDEGTYMVQFRDKTPDAVQEFATLDDREKIIQSFRANTVKISDGRLEHSDDSGRDAAVQLVERQPARLDAVHADQRRDVGVHQRPDAADGRAEQLLHLRRPERQRRAAEGVGRQRLPGPHARLSAVAAGEQHADDHVRHGAGDHAAEHVPGAAGDGPGRLDIHLQRRPVHPGRRWASASRRRRRRARSSR